MAIFCAVQREQVNKITLAIAMGRDCLAELFLYPTRMPWSANFPESIKLNDGREMASLSEARVFLLSLPASRQEEPHWVDAAAALSQASEWPPVIGDASAAMVRALKAEGLI